MQCLYSEPAAAGSIETLVFLHYYLPVLYHQLSHVVLLVVCTSLIVHLLYLGRV